MIELSAALDPAANLLSPRGKVLEHGMARFFRRVAEGVFDEADLITRAHDLADFAINAGQHYGFDLARVVAVGYSNGPNIAAGLLLLRPLLLIVGPSCFAPCCRSPGRPSPRRRRKANAWRRTCGGRERRLSFAAGRPVMN